MVISISELQRNISILKNLKEPLIVVDKRTKKEIAKIEPIGQKSDREILEEIVQNTPKSDIYVEDINKAFEEVYTEHLRKKYGVSD